MGKCVFERGFGLKEVSHFQVCLASLSITSPPAALPKWHLTPLRHRFPTCVELTQRCAIRCQQAAFCNSGSFTQHEEKCRVETRKITPAYRVLIWNRLRRHYQSEGRTEWAEMCLKIDPVCSEQTDYCLFVQVGYWPMQIRYQQTFLCSQGQHRSRHSNWQHVHKLTMHWRMRRQKTLLNAVAWHASDLSMINSQIEAIQWFSFNLQPNIHHYVNHMHCFTVIRKRNCTFFQF